MKRFSTILMIILSLIGVVIVAVAISMLAVFANSIDDSANVETYSHLKDYEGQYGLVECPSGRYTMGPVKESEEPIEYGVFRKIEEENGCYELVINLGHSLGAWFYEGNYYYFICGNYMTEYDLSNENPESSAKVTKILPNMANVQYIVSRDEKYLYVKATLWDNETNRSQEAKYYKVARDGSEYVEIEFEEISE